MVTLKQTKGLFRVTMIFTKNLYLFLREYIYILLIAF